MAICDSCETNILSKRFKCQACQDFDYCASCFRDASLIHPGHDFKLIDDDSSSGGDSASPEASENRQTQSPGNCPSCMPISYGLPTLPLVFENFQEETPQKLEKAMTKDVTDDSIVEDLEPRAEVAEELHRRADAPLPMHLELFKKIGWDRIYKSHIYNPLKAQHIYVAEEKMEQDDSDELNNEDRKRLGIGIAEAFMKSLGSYASISHHEWEREKDEITPSHNKPSNKLSLEWEVRISRLVEASQRGCEFCSFFLNKVFVSTYSDCLADIFGYGIKNVWYTDPQKNSKHRETAVFDCMEKLTKLKHDRFRFSITPLCSRKDAKLPDFNKIQFGLTWAADEHEILNEMFMYSGVFMGKGQGYNKLSFTVNVYTTDDDPAATDLTSRVPNASPDSDKAFGLVKQWTAFCNENHQDECFNSPGCRTDLPRRVIDVSGGQFLKLYEPSRGEQGTYTALSYCWGGSQAFQTMASTIDELRLGFELSMLPKTMRDAILVTQKLGLRYIWIDCLCIIQDIPSDKSYEFSQMANIYKRSYLTISATRGESVDEGFLINTADESTGLWKGLIPLAYRVPESTATTTEEALSFSGSQRGRIWLHDDSDNWKDSYTFPTTRRGWCLQEQLLSPRFLSYGRWPTWRCRKSTFTDGGYYYSPSNMNDTTETLENRLVDMIFDSPQSRNLSAGLDMFSTTQLYQGWYALIHDYSRRKIGFSSDILPAVGGIAAEISRLTGHRYLAGLWQDNILHDLMWFTKVREWSRRTPKWRAPSWSWASVVSTISYGNTTADSKPMATVRKCTVILKDPLSPFGEVSEASIEIRGPFSLVNTKYVNDLFKKQSSAPVRRKNRDGAEWFKKFTKHSLVDAYETNVVNSVTHEIEENPEIEGPVYGLITFSRDWRVDGNGKRENEICYSGLLLRRADDTLGELERIGSFTNESESWLDQRSNPWKEKSVVIT